MFFYEPTPLDIIMAAGCLVYNCDVKSARRYAGRSLAKIMVELFKEMTLLEQLNEQQPIRRFLSRLADSLTDEGWQKIREAIALYDEVPDIVEGTTT